MPEDRALGLRKRAHSRLKLGPTERGVRYTWPEHCIVHCRQVSMRRSPSTEGVSESVEQLGVSEWCRRLRPEPYSWYSREIENEQGQE